MTSTIKPYSQGFYDETFMISVRSAQHIVPMVLELLKPESVVDLGCGPAGWLSVFESHGVDVFGVDGPWINSKHLRISTDKFRVQDLNQPVKLDRKFDLAISLEVAEHLSESSADTIVDSLTSLSQVVLFSAAVPHQGGTNHINEQWPEYWAEKFAARGYRVIDCFRQRIWQDEDVAYWFAQNLLLYVHEDYLKTHPLLAHQAALTEPKFLSRVHPKMFLKNRESLTSPKTILMRKVWNAIPLFLRVRLVKYVAHRIWEQVNAKY